MSIAADPKNDAPRLVLPDWLEERGFEKYGEFIRLGIDVHRKDIEYQMMDLSFDHRQSLLKPLRDRIGRLLRHDRAVLTSGIHPDWQITDEPPDFSRRPLDYPVAHYHRGLVGYATCRLGEWIDNGPVLSLFQPMIGLRITDVSPFYGTLDRAISDAIVSVRGLNPTDWFYLVDDRFPPGGENIGSEIAGSKKVEWGDFAGPFPTQQAARIWLLDRCLEWAKEEATDLLSKIDD